MGDLNAYLACQDPFHTTSVGYKSDISDILEILSISNLKPENLTIRLIMRVFDPTQPEKATLYFS